MFMTKFTISNVAKMCLILSHICIHKLFDEIINKKWRFPVKNYYAPIFVWNKIEIIICSIYLCILHQILKSWYFNYSIVFF